MHEFLQQRDQHKDPLEIRQVAKTIFVATNNVLPNFPKRVPPGA
jgi:hypothetical protein